jgi:hypothetical protein
MRRTLRDVRIIAGGAIAVVPRLRRWLRLYNRRRWLNCYCWRDVGIWIGVDWDRVEIPSSRHDPPPAEATDVPSMCPVTAAPHDKVMLVKMPYIPVPSPVPTGPAMPMRVSAVPMRVSAVPTGTSAVPARASSVRGCSNGRSEERH